MTRGAILLGALAALLLGAGGEAASAGSGGGSIAGPPAATRAPAASPAGAGTTVATPTGNLLVLLDENRAGAAVDGSSIQSMLAQLGAHAAGRSVPEIGLVTVEPPPNVSTSAFGRVLASLPGVASAQPELRYALRMVPSDPALTTVDQTTHVDWQWYLAREGFYRAWDLSRGRGALVGMIDTGIDAKHPDLASKIAATVDQQSPADSTGPADTDQVGHGTHVASLACAATNNGLGIAGAGYDCRLVMEKTDFTDSSIDAAIVDATKRHVGAINMSFGPSAGGTASAPRSEVRALDYAAAHRVVLVAAASDSPSTEQGDPANVLQPPGTGPQMNDGIGLDVTAADYNGSRASFSGSGTEISLAAYGAFEPSGNVFSPCSAPTFGLLGAYPANSTVLEAFPPTACRVDFDADNRYATIAGTSMAAPQVSATAAMMRVLNPYATLQDLVRAIKRTAQRPPGERWNGNLGWGILDAGAALDAIRRVDHLAPSSKLIAPNVTHHASFVLHWTGHDQQRPGLIASGIAYFELFVRRGNGRAVLLARTARRSWRFTGRPGHRYVFWLVAVDRAGNHQRNPRHVSAFVA